MKFPQSFVRPFLFAALTAAAAVMPSAFAATIVQQAYLKASNTGPGDAFGWSVGLSGDTLVVGAYQEDSNATGVNGDQSNDKVARAGAAYVFVREGTNWVQQAYLKASNTTNTVEGAGFGWAVAVSRDTIAVGAVAESSSAIGVNGNQTDTNASYSGAVYVFVRNGTNWTQQAYLKASNLGGRLPGQPFGDLFGHALSLSGDTLVVGAFQEDSNATGVNGNQSNESAPDSGAANVFVRDGTNWTQEAYLKPSNTDAGDRFGISVGISADTAVIGSWAEGSGATGINGNDSDNRAAGSGAAYVFVRDGTNWTQQAYLKASNTGPGDAFGRAVAISGNTIAVGAYQEDSNATGIGGNQTNNSSSDSGAVYVFTRDGTNWSQQAYVKASNTGAGDWFGYPVSLSGDTMVVGAAGFNLFVEAVGAERTAMPLG